MRCGNLRAAMALILATATLAWGGPAARSQDDTPPPGPGKVLDLVPKVLDIVSTLTDLGAEVTEKEIKIALSGDVLFDFDKDTLRPDAFPTLQKVALVLSQHPDAPVLIEGHTDNKGKDAYNQKLSERRAASVKKWLVEAAGAKGGRITTKGWGETKPAVPNEKPDGSDDPDGRQKNRRVEITIKTG